MHIINNGEKTFLALCRNIDELSTIGPGGGGEFNCLKEGDLTFIDTRTREYSGQLCLVKTPKHDFKYYTRVFVEDGEIITVCPWDGEEWGRFPLEDVAIEGVVTGIYRSLKPAPKVNPAKPTTQRMFDQIKALRSDFRKGNDFWRYSIGWDETQAIRAKSAGAGGECVMDAFTWGFIKGQRALRAKQKRQRKAQATKEAAV